jgi:hypothetical protein
MLLIQNDALWSTLEAKGHRLQKRSALCLARAGWASKASDATGTHWHSGSQLLEHRPKSGFEFITRLSKFVRVFTHHEWTKRDTPTDSGEYHPQRYGRRSVEIERKTGLRQTTIPTTGRGVAIQIYIPLFSTEVHV